MSYFISTTESAESVSLKEAVFRGLAPDGGLYLPKQIPSLDKGFFEHIEGLAFEQIAVAVSTALLGDNIEKKEIEKIVYESFNFPVPLVPVEPHVWALELFHGPTLSFKDFGARFMARLFHYFLEKEQQPLNILVATSGDTGSAVAHGFYGVEGINVWVLYPKGKVSLIQEKQMTTLGKNVTALEVAGNFDDCQRLVKEAFQDRELNTKLQLTSANSINIARLIPQSFYYFYAYSKLVSKKLPLVISVPSGNFGNLTAGILAKRMGLPIERFVAATNDNDIVPKYLETGVFTPRPSKATLSNAMDVGNPSNFARLQYLYSSNCEQMRSDLFGASFTNAETIRAIKEVKDKFGYQLDPHGAVAYLGLEKYFSQTKRACNAVFLETAHPAKFGSDMGMEIPMPERLAACLDKEKIATSMSPDYACLKKLLLCGL